MPVARYQMPDGRIARYEVPEGTTPEQAQAMISKTFSAAGLGETPAFEKEAAQIAGTTGPELIAGSAPGRFILGAASPFIGAGQTVANAMGLGDWRGPLGTTVNESVASLEQMKRRGMAAQPSRADAIPAWASPTGWAANQVAAALPETDVAGTAGTLASPAAVGAMKLPLATTMGGKAAQGAGIGAGFGATAPLEDFSWGNKAAGTAAGAAIGGAIPPAVAGVRAGGRLVRNVVDPWLPGGIERMEARTLNAAAGDQRQALIAALRGNREIVPGSTPTAGEAGAPAGAPAFNALQEIVAPRAPAAYDAIAQRQNAARVAALRSFGKDRGALDAAKATRSENAAEAYGAVNADRINPKSDTQIMRDAIAGREASRGEAFRDWGRFTTTAAQQQDKAANWYPVPGQPRAPARYSPHAEREQEAIRAGYDALNVAALRGKERDFLISTMDTLKNTVGLDDTGLHQFLSRPSMRAAVQDAIKSAQETGAYFPKKAGQQFSVQNLQRIKESLDAGIAAAEKQVLAGKRPELSPTELEGTRTSFVKWLSNKSPGWAQARQGYSADSVPINQMQIGQALEDKLVAPLAEQGAGTSQRAAMYAQALRDEPRVLKNALGRPRYDTLEEALLPPNAQAAREVGADLARKAEHERLSKLGMEQARRLLGEEVPKVPAAGMFNPKYSVVRAVLNRLAGRLNEKALDDLAIKMQDAPEIARIMEKTTPPAQRERLISALLQRSGAIAAGMGAGSQ